MPPPDSALSPRMYLIQLLLPAITPSGAETSGIARTRKELVDRFGGVTVYARTPAEGEWRDSHGATSEDTLVLVEVVAPTFDRGWWTSYVSMLAKRFAQDAVHVRASQVEMLDPHAA